MKKKARIAGIFSLVTFVAGSLGLMLPGSGLAAGLNEQQWMEQAGVK